METVNLIAKDLKKLMQDVAQIKEMLLTANEDEMDEIELTDWARAELEEQEAALNKSMLNCRMLKRESCPQNEFRSEG